MIKEIPTGNWFQRTIWRNIPGSRYRYLSYSEYQVPDDLDFEIKQFQETTVVLKGSKDDLSIICTTPQGPIDLAFFAPRGTRFKIDGDKYSTFSANRKTPLISLPCDLRYLLASPVPYVVLHEIGHHWNYKNEEWMLKWTEADKFLKDEAIERDLKDYGGLPWRWEEKQREIDAWRIMGEDEQRAWYTAIYIHGRLKQVGMDMIPQGISKLTGYMNRGLKSYEKKFTPNKRYLRHKFRLKKQAVETILSGQMPCPELQEIVDKHLATVLPGITEMVRTNEASRQPRKRFSLEGILANAPALRAVPFVMVPIAVGFLAAQPELSKALDPSILKSAQMGLLSLASLTSVLAFPEFYQRNENYLPTSDVGI